MPTLHEILVQSASEQAAIVGNLVKNLGVLSTAQVGFSSDYLRHEYVVATADPTAAVRAVGGSIIPSSGNEITASIQLPQIGSYVSADVEKVLKFGSLQAYLNQPNRTEAYTRACLQKLETATIYGDNPTFGVSGAFKGFHQIAKANSAVSAQLGGASGSRTSIFAVHYSPDEVQFVIPAMSTGLMVNAELIGGGTLQGITTNTTTDARKLTYEAYFWLNAAFQAGHNYSVGAITQADSTHKPTSIQIDALIDSVKGLADGMTFIYVNRTGRQYLRNLKSTMYVDTSNTAYNTEVASWNGIPIILTESILSTETTALD